LSSTKQQIDFRQLRSFGLIVGGIFAFIGIWPAFFHRDIRVWALLGGGLLISQALLLPRTLWPIYRVWMVAGHAMGWVNTRILLALGFFAIVTPSALALRMLGKDPMRRKFDPETNSYRTIRESRPGSHMRRQF
jgi:hypothetical protein